MAQGGSMMDRAIGLTVTVIVVVGVALPVIQQVIADQNFTGTLGLIMTYVPYGLAVGVLVAAFSLVRR